MEKRKTLQWTPKIKTRAFQWYKNYNFMTKFGFFMIFFKQQFWFLKSGPMIPEWPGYHKWHLRQVAQTSAKLTPGQSNPGETKTMEATIPELGPVRFWSPKSSSFSGSDSIVVEAAKNFLCPRPSVNKSGAPNFFIQHDKVEDSKLRRYLETFGRALEQFLQRRTCRSTDW